MDDAIKTSDSSTLSSGTFVTYVFILQGFQLSDICSRMIISFRFFSFFFFLQKSMRPLLASSPWEALAWVVWWRSALIRFALWLECMSHSSNTCSPDGSLGTDRKRTHQFHSLQGDHPALVWKCTVQHHAKK